MPMLDETEEYKQSAQDAKTFLELPDKGPLNKRNSDMQIAKYAQIIADKLKNVRFSGLTDVRTVSDELSDDESSDCFSRDSDQTLHITKIDEKELDKIIRASIAEFVANPAHHKLNSEQGHEEYDSEKAALWQKQVD